MVPSADPLTTTLSSWFQWTVLTLCSCRAYRVVACELFQSLSRHHIPHEDGLVAADGSYSAVVRRAVIIDGHLHGQIKDLVVVDARVLLDELALRWIPDLLLKKATIIDLSCPPVVR